MNRILIKRDPDIHWFTQYLIKEEEEEMGQYEDYVNPQANMVQDKMSQEKYLSKIYPSNSILAPGYGAGGYQDLNSYPGHIMITQERLVDLHKTMIARMTGAQNTPRLSPPKKMTGQEYVAINANGNIIATNKDLAVIKKLAADHAHSAQGSVYIFRPVLEIAPKRDVVESSITLE